MVPALLTVAVAASLAAAPPADPGAPPAPGDALLAWLASPEGIGTLDRATGAARTLNGVTLLHLGRRSLPARLALVAGAERYVFMTVPYWFRDTQGRRMLEAFRARKEAGPLDLRLLTDWSGPVSSGDPFGTRMYRQLKALADGRMRQWNRVWQLRPWSWNVARYRLHEKLMVVDGERVIVGGMNVADEYLEGGVTADGWHDTDLLLEGPAAQEAARIFLKTYLFTRYISYYANPFGRDDVDAQVDALRALFARGEDGYGWHDGLGLGLARHTLDVGYGRYEGDPFWFPPLPAREAWRTPVRLVYDNPLVDVDPETRRPFSRTMDTLEVLLPRAEHHVRLFVPYLTLTKRFRVLLARTARRGVRVQVLTNSLKSHDLGDTAYYGALRDYLDLTRAGVEVWEWQGHEDLVAFAAEHGCEIAAWPGRTLHTKAVVVDGAVTLLGSHNLNVRSERYNSELMTLVESRELGGALDAIFDEDLDRDTPRTLPCAGGAVEGRPPRALRIDGPLLDHLMGRYGRKSKFWRLFKMYM